MELIGTMDGNTLTLNRPEGKSGLKSRRMLLEVIEGTTSHRSILEDKKVSFLGLEMSRTDKMW